MKWPSRCAAIPWQSYTGKMPVPPGRSWKAATWLLKYLGAKIASHEETPEECRERQEREAYEFFGRAPAPGVRKRRVLG
jgi:hypothetical protein